MVQPNPRRIEWTITSLGQIDTPAALKSLESRGFVQRTEVFGRSFAFEYPRGTGNFCIIKCCDCGWLCELSPDFSMPIENHWLITRFHRELNRNENRRPPSIREILEQHTYRVEGATRQWATESNGQTVAKKNAARHPGGSQASNTTPQSRSNTKPSPRTKTGSSTKPSSQRFVAPLDKSYRGRIRSDGASEKHELQSRASLKATWADERASSSILSSPCSDYDEVNALASAFGACEAEVPNQEKSGEFIHDDFTRDGLTHEDSTRDNVTPDNVTDEEVTDEEVVYIRTVVRQILDMPAPDELEVKQLADIKTEPGLDL